MFYKISPFADSEHSCTRRTFDSIIPVAFIEHVSSLGGEDKFYELLDSGAPFAQHPYAIELKRKMDEADAKMKEEEDFKRSFIGQKFTDLEEADPDGNMHKLSEYVGKGTPVLSGNIHGTAGA